MGKFKQLSLCERTIIETYLNDGKTATFIAEKAKVNKSSIIREIRKNRIKRRESLCKIQCICIGCMKYNECKVKSLCTSSCKCNCKGCSKAKDCPHKELYDCNIYESFPYVCNSCPKKDICPKEQYEYDAMMANQISEKVRRESRQGIDMTQEEFDHFNKKILEAVKNGQSIFHLVETKQVNRCTKSVYSYIDRNILDTKNIDLPRKVKLKKRKIAKKYQYDGNSEIDRSGRMFNDFLLYKFSNKTSFHAQMDFLGSKDDSPQQIFTITFVPCQFTLLAVFDKCSTVDDVVNFFDNLEETLGTKEFKSIFEVMLTDRDILFKKFNEFERSAINPNEKRMKVFYCDPSASYQKGNVENVNGQIRTIFPKEDIIKGLDDETIKIINSNLNNRSLASLNGSTPYEAFKLAYGEKILQALDISYILPKDVKILNYRAYKD